MSDRDQRAETSKTQQNGGTKDGRKDKLKGKKFLNIKRLYTSLVKVYLMKMAISMYPTVTTTAFAKLRQMVMLPFMLETVLKVWSMDYL